MHTNTFCTFRGVLETAVHNRSEELWFEKEIPESGTVDGHVTSLHVLFSGLSCRSIGRLELEVGIRVAYGYRCYRLSLEPN